MLEKASAVVTILAPVVTVALWSWHRWRARRNDRSFYEGESLTFVDWPRRSDD